MNDLKIKLSVIIVTWNSQQDIENCLLSVFRSITNIPSEVIVVDNQSNDKSVKIVLSKFPKVQLFEQIHNHGFGQGNNIGLAKAKGSYILLLNPDTIINSKAIQCMINFLDAHPKVGIVGPEQFNGNGNTIYMLSRLSFTGCVEYYIEKVFSIFYPKKILFAWPHKTFMLNTGCMLARANILPTRQWFDPDCFIYGEEYYLFKQVKKHWQVYFLRNCSIIHLREKSIMQTRNKTKFALDSARVIIKKPL
jgi:GT2 family glycosyltransferase